MSTYPQPVLIRARIIPPSGQISSVRSTNYAATHTPVARAFQPEHLPERFWPPERLLPTESVPCTLPLTATKTPPNSPPNPRGTARPCCPTTHQPHHTPAPQHSHPRTPVRGSPVGPPFIAQKHTALTPADSRPRLACGTAVHRPKTHRTHTRGLPSAARLWDHRSSPKNTTALTPADFRPRLACGTAVHRPKTQQTHTRGLPSAARRWDRCSSRKNTTDSHPRTPVRGSPAGPPFIAQKHISTRTRGLPSAARRWDGRSSPKNTTAHSTANAPVLCSGWKARAAFGGWGEGAVSPVDSRFNEPSGRATAPNLPANTEAASPTAQAATPRQPQTSPP